MNSTPLEKDHQFLTRTILNLTDQIDLFETFQDLSLKIISQFDLKNICAVTCDIIQEVMNYKSASIYLFNSDNITFQKAYHAGETNKNQMAPEFDEKLVSWIMNQGRWTILTEFQEKSVKEIISILPLKSPSQSLGFMVITTKFDPEFYKLKLSAILNFLAAQTAIAIENQNLYARLNNSNAYMTNMLESINNGLMAMDKTGRVTLINRNATAILGIKKRNLTGFKYGKFLTGELKKELDKLFETILKKGFAAESMIPHSPYKEIDIVVGVTPSLLTDRKKKTIGVIFIFRDMSASKEIERLTRLDEMKSEFVSTVSHELRTPLSVIKSYTEALITQVKPDDYKTREQFLSVIDSETDRLADIVSNLLDLSRIESGKFDLDITAFPLEELINSVAHVYRSRRKNIHILTDFSPSLPMIHADEGKIKEVLVNLITNSIKFSPTGGTISINLEKKGNFLACSVSDTGIGMPRNKLNKIFEKFFRVDSSDTSAIEGTGLGLSIVKHIIDSHNGKIMVDSILGKGSVFTFYLPVTRS